uniref:Uncharacterized protein n=1 Tax=Avena sativa TaxID=4498 RepID=A0ACD5UT00_AVESA
MKSVAIILVVLVLSVAPGSNACQRDPSMTIAAACEKVSTGQAAMSELCMKTLHAAAHENSAVSEYAYFAGTVALESCETTERSGKQLLQNPSLPKELRAAYNHCVDKYDIAQKKISDLLSALYVCWYPHFKQDCNDAAAAIDDCAHKLQPIDSSSPFYKMVLADRDRTALACSLAGLGIPTLVN